MNGMKELISVEEARTIVQTHVRPGAIRQVPLEDAAGYILAQDIVSRDNIPLFDNSGMDGFAVRTADLAHLPATLLVSDDIAAGTAPSAAVSPGACARIMTGAPVPAGADAIVPVEWTRDDREGLVVVERAPSAGQFIRWGGRDVAAGDKVLRAGTLITPPVVGMLATVGAVPVPVFAQPAVAIVTTGDELVPPDRSLEGMPGCIRNSNGPALQAQVLAAGGRAGRYLHATDDRDDIRAVLQEALAADVIVLSGGVSVGKYDYVKEVLGELGLQLLFWRVRQRPGKPLAFGLLEGKPVFGLPGNPVSSSVCFEQYVRPALRQMQGGDGSASETVRARLGRRIEKAAGLHHFVRGRAWYEEGRLTVVPTGDQASNLYSSMVRANCLVHLAEDVEHPEEGEGVPIEWLPWAALPEAEGDQGVL